MAPVVAVLQWGPYVLPVYGYGFMLCLAALVGGGLLLSACHRRGLDVGAVIAVLGAVGLLGFCGARSMWWLVALAQGTPVAWTSPGGVVFYGGLLLGGVGAVLAARLLKVPCAPLFEAGVVPLCVGHALGRVGCLLGGCCFGKPWSGPWAVTYHDSLAPVHGGIPRHPVPVYEALGLLVLALIASRLSERAPLGGPGPRVLLYGCGYTSLRFGLEYLRDDSVRGLFGRGQWSTSQLLSLALLLATLGLLVFRHVRSRGTQAA